MTWRTAAWAIYFLCLAVAVFGADGKPDYAQVDRWIEKLDTTLPINLIKSVAWQESRWRQFENGKPHIHGNDIGIMQVNETTARLFGFDVDRLKWDTRYNLSCGVKILQSKVRYVARLKQSTDWPAISKRYALSGLTDLELAIIAYNGFSRDHLYLIVVYRAWINKPWTKYF